MVLFRRLFIFIVCLLFFGSCIAQNLSIGIKYTGLAIHPKHEKNAPIYKWKTGKRGHFVFIGGITFTLDIKIYKFIGIRIKKLERRLQLLLFKDSKTRLVEFLEELCTDYGYDCNQTGDHIINHPYTQKDIASLIGISRPTLNILMNELKEESVIDFNRKQIRIYKTSA